MNDSEEVRYAKAELKRFATPALWKGPSTVDVKKAECERKEEGLFDKWREKARCGQF